MSDKDFDGFRNWLISKNYKGRYLSDIISRLRRAVKITGVDDPVDISISIVIEFLENEGKSESVIIHIKNSVKLYKEYKSLKIDYS